MHLSSISAEIDNFVLAQGRIQDLIWGGGGGAQIVTGLKLPFWGLSFVEFWCWGLIFGGQGGAWVPGAPPGSAPVANQVNVNKIMIFFTTILCSLKAPVKALIGFGRCYVPSADSLSCSEQKSVCTVLMHQLQANSWKYTCLRTMDCLHHVTATWKVLKGLSHWVNCNLFVLRKCTF